MADIYNRELKRIFDNKDPIPTTRTREEIEAAIAKISEALLGPVSNVERLCLVGNRQILRNELASLPA